MSYYDLVYAIDKLTHLGLRMTLVLVNGAVWSLKLDQSNTFSYDEFAEVYNAVITRCPSLCSG